MRILAAVVLIACLAPAGLGFGPPGFVESRQELAPLYAEQVAAIQNLQRPSLTAASATLVDGESGAILFTYHSDEPRPMASITKIMTALVAIERGMLDAKVQIAVDSAMMTDSSVMGLRPGEELTLEDLLYGLLLPSGNDAAIAIAEFIGGGVPQFVEAMNDRARSLELRSTHFANPHGLDAPDHYSSAADLAVLARTAMANPVFARIISTRERTVRGRLYAYQLRNTNALLGRVEGVNGVKTGTTDAAGQCLVASTQRNAGWAISVVLGSGDRYSDTEKLIDHYYRDFDCERPALRLSPFYSLQGGSAEDAESDAQSNDPTFSSAAVLFGPWDCRPRWQQRWRRATVDLSRSEQFASGKSGAANFYVGDVAVGSVPIDLP